MASRKLLTTEEFTDSPSAAGPDALPRVARTIERQT